MVPKSNGKVRICVELTHLNEIVKREIFSIPSLKKMAPKLFTKFDNNSGFWQIPLTNSTYSLNTFSAPFGGCRFLRLSFGISSAPDIFQRQISETIGIMEGVICHFDDITVFGKTLAKHDARLRKILTKLQDEGWTLTFSKCSFRIEYISLLGHAVTKDGIIPDPKKVKAVKELQNPNNIQEIS
ncbi:hypothetical protein PR048_000485 [Dryococelus australis]|uniref:Reverse transcriptase domain-containing protein n=1 Tax=Dryococelus australis TaxID=614101 RepID=A0ABQ9IEQ8_9NEOP|nr:hypothetical protein PR048_000485 [Dryococelus australis]